MELDMPRRRIVATFLCVALAATAASAADKADQIRGQSPKHTAATAFARPADRGLTGSRIVVEKNGAAFPLVVVRGTPYEMGRQLGQLMQKEMAQFVPAALAGVTQELKVSQETMCEVWSRSAAFADDRVEQELAGLADGSGLPLATLQAFHAGPLLMPYSCSSIAAWGDATENGHLLMTRNLDWTLKLKAQEFPVIVVYIPEQGTPHVIPTFAGMIGAHTGMNVHGIALAEMGDAPEREMPYQVHAPHFTVFFRTLLYDADSLTRALDIFQTQPLTKRYHFVFGDGRAEHRAVKIRAHSPEDPNKQVVIWSDNDSSDEFAPNVLSCVVYNDEGRGAFPTLKREHGKMTPAKMIDLANHIPIKGGNVVDVVYDATDLKLWLSYAKGDQEAYQRPYVEIDLKTLDADHDGQPDIHL